MLNTSDSSSIDVGIVCGGVHLSFDVYALTVMTFFIAIFFARVGKHFLGYNTSRPLPSRAVVSKKLWTPGQVIGYAFLGGTDRQHQKVESGFKTWELYANLSFQRNTTSPVLRISFNQGGPWSYIGRECEDIPADEPTMDLTSVDPATPKSSPREQGNILHELGHLLGLGHEHQRPAAGLTWNKPVLFAHYAAHHGWNKATVLEQVIQRIGKNDVMNSSRLDLHSIMTYPLPKNANHQGIEFERNNDLSNLDKAADPGWTFQHALTIAGVDPATQLVLLAHHFQGDWNGIRLLFSKWCWDNRRQSASHK